MTGVANLDRECAGKAVLTGPAKTGARCCKPLPVMVAKASFVAFQSHFAVNMNYLAQPLGDAS